MANSQHTTSSCYAVMSLHALLHTLHVHRMAFTYLIIALVSIVRAYEPQEICRWESLNATCTAGEVIVMESARYGRMSLGRCLSRDYFVGCAADVIRHADERCSGRHDCVIKVPDETLHEVQPCPKDILAYMEAGYSCVPVATGGNEKCQGYKPLVLSGQAGSIGNVITEEKGHGSMYCPWVIKVDRGQRINVTLYDFATLQFNQESPICQVYATLKERTRTRDITVCAGGERVKHLTISDTNELEITIVTHSTQPTTPYFLLRYEALGCPDPKPPAHGWIERTGDNLLVGCNATSLKWHLVCKENKWYGEFNNCTPIATGSWSLGEALSGDSGMPYGLFISVAIGVILGILLGAFMLSMVLLCRRWRKNGFPGSAGFIKPTQVSRGPVPPPGNRMYDPSTLKGGYPISVSAGVHGKDTGGGYAHIWELRQGMPGAEDTYGQGGATTKRSNHSDPGFYSCQTDDISSSGQTMRKEHVYESPKLGRRNEEMLLCEGVPYYHEFDPNMASAGGHHGGHIGSHIGGAHGQVGDLLLDNGREDLFNRNCHEYSLTMHDD